jgi:DNA-directed RNA polymerase subunit RPC12/RpoP
MTIFPIQHFVISAVSESNWKIEHQCPQCGAPVVIDEADRLLSCPFCKTKLYLMTPDHFRYYIPAPDQASRDMVYLPYWRLKGTSFSVEANEISPRFVDTSILATYFPGLPRSLGLRPQAMKVKYISPDMPGQFMETSLQAQAVIPAIEPSDPSGHSFHQAFIGKMISLVYSPAYLEKDTLYDALLGRPLSAWKKDETARTPADTKPSNWQIRFISTLCPRCGWNLQGEKDALVMICKNCDSAWICSKTEFETVPFSVMTTFSKESILYLPFWRMKPRVEGIHLVSYADLIRLANLPKVINSDFESAPLYFWSPAFKVNPALYLRWARQMTTFQPEGKTSETFAGASFYQVTLADQEAVKSMKITLADLVVDKRQIYPKLADIQVSADEIMLVYHPFIVGPHELIHETMHVTIDRTALSYGTYL